MKLDLPRWLPIAVRQYAVDEFRRQEDLANKGFDEASSDSECLRRLVSDERMEDAFEILSREFTEDTRWCGFVDAAWSARSNFAEFRDARQRAEAIICEIPVAARRLAYLLDELAAIGIETPTELVKLPDLLRAANGNDARWPWAREVILGYSIRTQAEEAPDSDLQEIASPTVRYAWSKAPGLAALLHALSIAAERGALAPRGLVGAATRSRKRNDKSEYLRGFCHLLKNEHQIAMSGPIFRAIAITATVALDLPMDTVVDEREVRIASEAGG